jgi:hypothetical protein
MHRYKKDKPNFFYGHAGAILVLGRDLVMVPKLIHPLPPNMPGTPKSPAYGEPIEEEPPTPHPMTDTWMQVSHVPSQLGECMISSMCCEAIQSRICSCLLLLFATCEQHSASHQCAPAMPVSCCDSMQALGNAMSTILLTLLVAAVHQ